jgi:hypothetical protein
LNEQEWWASRWTEGSRFPLERMQPHVLEQFKRDVFKKMEQLKQAAMAVAHCLLVIIYHVLRDKKLYSDLGADYFDHMDKERLTRQSLRRLEALGYEVTLTPKQEVMA